MTFYLRALYDTSKQVRLLVVLADAATNCAAFAQSVIYAEAHHGVLAFAAFGKFAEELRHHAERVTIVEVVAVENCKGLLDDVFTHHNSVVGAPRLLTSFGYCEAFWQRVEALEAQFAGNVALILRQNLRAELLLEVVTDDPHDLSKASLNSVVYAVIHDALALRTERIKLLQAAITATHTCSKKE